MEICYPSQEDAEYVVNHLNKNEQFEIYCLVGSNMLEDLLEGIKQSEVVGCAKENGVPIAIYGLRKPAVISDRYLVWAYFTDDIYKHRVIYGRHMKRAVQQILARYGCIYNYVPVASVEISNWLRSLGAEFTGPYYLGPFKIPHWCYEIRR